MPNLFEIWLVLAVLVALFVIVTLLPSVGLSRGPERPRKQGVEAAPAGSDRAPI